MEQTTQTTTPPVQTIPPVQSNPNPVPPVQPTPSQVPPVTPPQPPQKKSHVLAWVLGGCLAFLIISGLIVGGMMYWGYKKVKREIKENTPNLEKFKEDSEDFQKQWEQIEKDIQKEIEAAEREGKLQTN